MDDGHASRPAQTQISIRLPEDWVGRLDAIAAALARPGTHASRADALRHVVATGLAPTEHALGIATSGARVSR